MRSRARAFLYITSGDKLLVLTHVDHPHLGLQIPGGTIEPGETPEVAALREGQEETGLEGLSIQTLLGVCTRDMTDFGKNELLHCWYFHLIAKPPIPVHWQHIETDPSDGEESEILFELHWQQINEPFELGGIDDQFLPELRHSMSRLS